MTALGEYARILIQIDVPVRLAQDEINLVVLDLLTPASLAESFVGTPLSTDRRTLMTTGELLLAAPRAWYMIAWGRARHRARAMRAGRQAFLLGTGRARLMAFLDTLRVTATDITGSLARRAGFLTMTAGLASMSTRRILPTTFLFANSMISPADDCAITYYALQALPRAGVPARQVSSTWSCALVSRIRNINRAVYANLVFTAGHDPLDNRSTANGGKVSSLPAGKVLR